MHWLVLKMAWYIVKMVTTTTNLICVMAKEVNKDVHCKLGKKLFCVQDGKSPGKNLKCSMIFNQNFKSFLHLKPELIRGLFIFDVVSKLMIL